MGFDLKHGDLSSATILPVYLMQKNYYYKLIIDKKGKSMQYMHSHIKSLLYIIILLGNS